MLPLVGLTIWLFAASGAAAASPSSPYVAYAACGLGKHAAPAHKCTRGSKVGAFFESSSPVQYTICVVFPGGRRLCAQDQNAAAGKLKINTVTTNKLGRHKLVWYVSGVKIVRYFRLVAG